MLPCRQEVGNRRGRGQSFLQLQHGYCGHYQHVNTLYLNSAKKSSGGENIVQEELATAADNSSFHENFNNPDGANGVNKTETARNTDSGQTGSLSEG